MTFHEHRRHFAEDNIIYFVIFYVYSYFTQLFLINILGPSGHGHNAHIFFIYGIDKDDTVHKNPLVVLICKLK